MTIDHGRRYGEKPSRPIYVWNGLLERKHFEKIGPAIWLFLWLINAVTREKDGKGFVLGGAPINCAAIAKSFGVNEQTIRAHLDRLEKRGYIERTLTPRGYSVRVLNSAKFTNKLAHRGSGQIPDHGRAKIYDQLNRTPDHGIEEPRPNKSKELEETAGQAPLDPVWEAIGVASSHLPLDFQKLVEKQWLQRDTGQLLSKFMGGCLDLWRSSEGKAYPAAFCKRKVEITREERERGPALQPTRPLPEKPFQKRNWKMEELCTVKS